MKKIITIVYILFLTLHLLQAQPVFVKDISPRATNFISMGDIVFFTSNDSLFKSDGTPEGTIFLQDGLNDPTSFLVNNGLLYFVVPNELWRSDGTPGGTFLLAVSVPATNSLRILSPLGNKVVFVKRDPAYDEEPYVTDGTLTGTVLLKDIYPGFNPSLSRLLGVLDGQLFFSALTFNPAIVDTDYELWKTDGTPLGTVMVKDINPTESGFILFSSIRHSSATTATDVFFIADDGTHGFELWKSNGTSAGTVMVKDIVPGTGSSFSFMVGSDYHTLFTPQSLTEAGGIVYFFAGDIHTSTADYNSLWKSDGTEAGTVLVKNIPMDNINSVFELNGKLIISGSAGISSQLWVSDGTEAGTILIKDQLRGGDNYLSDFTIVGNQVVFTDNIQGFAFQLWKTNGTLGGTQLIREMNSRPNDFEVVNNTLFFTEHAIPTFFESGDGINDYELWQSDLTTGGTFMVKEISDMTFAGSHNLTNVNGSLYFTTSIPVSNPSFLSTTTSKKLWKYSVPVAVAHELTLVSSDVDTDIRPLADVDTVYVDQNITIRAKTSGLVQSVRFYINDVLTRNENEAPYALAGDNSGDFHKWIKTPGLYKISAIAFTGNNGTGTASDTLSRYVRVIYPTDTTTSIPFVLVNASSDTDIRTLHDNDTIVLVSSDRISIKAVPVFARSVVFVLNGSIYRTENSSPFSLGGDDEGNYSPWNATAGNHTLIANVYSGVSGTGTLLQSDTIHYTVIISPSMAMKVAAYPNPVQNNTSIDITSDIGQTVELMIMDNLGKIYMQQNISLSSGQNFIPMDLSKYHLPQGVYYIKISGEKEESLVKVYKE